MNTLKIDKKALEAARRQFCLDIGMPYQEYLNEPDRKVYICKAVYAKGSQKICSAGARNYEGRVDFFHAMICLGQLFLVVDGQIYDWAIEKFADCAPEWFCQYDNLREIDRKLQEYGYTIKDTHVYFLPEEDRQKEMGEETDSIYKFDCVVSETGTIHEVTGNCIATSHVCWYSQEEIMRFQGNNRFTSAICFSKTQPDMLAVATRKEEVWGHKSMPETGTIRNEETASKEKVVSDEPPSKRWKRAQNDGDLEFDQSRLSGMAGVSADGEYLWQIGINVIPEAAGKGLAHYLVRLLKERVQKLGKVPFYGTSESHTVSQTVGLKAGFVPAWTEVYVRASEQEKTV